MRLPSLLRVEQDERFASLTYKEQQYVRYNKVLKDLQNDVRFTNLSPQEKDVVIKSIVGKRKPVFSSNEFKQTASQFLSRLEQGDNQAMLQFIKNIQGRAAMQGGLITSAGVLAGMKLNDWRANNGIRNEFAKYATSGFMQGTDADKFYIYASQKIFNKNPESREKFQQAMKLLEISSPILGFGADLATMWGGSVALSGALLAPTGLAGKALTTATKPIGRFLAKVGIPAVADAILGGSYGVAQKNMVALATGNPDELTDTVREVGRAFGEYAAWDLALGMVLPPMLEHVGAFTKRIFGKGAKNSLIRGKLDDAEYKQILDGIGRGDLPEQQFNMLSDVGKDIYNQNYVLRNLGRNFEDVAQRPIEKTMLQADMNGFYIRQLDDGRFRLTSQGSDTPKKGQPIITYKTETYDTLGDLKREMSNEAIRRYKRLDPASRAEWDANPLNAELKKLGLTTNNINEVFDTSYKLGLDDATKQQIKAGRTKDYKSPVQRITITDTEADELIKNGAIKVDIDTEDILKQRLLKNPRRFLPQGQSARLASASSNDTIKKGIVIANTPLEAASQSDQMILKYADSYVAGIRAKNPSIRESDADLRSMFLLENGYDSIIYRNPDGVISEVETLVPNRVRLIDEVEDLIQSNKLDITQAKRASYVNNNLDDIRVQEGIVTGNKVSIDQYWSQFENKRKLKNFKKILGTDNFRIYKTEYGNVHLDIDDIGVHREFENLAQAKKYAETDLADIGKLLEEADRRGLKLAMKNGALEFTDEAGKSKTIRSSDELTDYLSKHPEVEEAYEIFEELDPGFTATYRDVILSQDQRVVPNATMKTDLSSPNSMVYNGINDGDIRLTFGEQSKRLFTQTDKWVEDVVSRHNLPELMSGYRGMKRAAAIKNGQYHNMLEIIYNDIFTSPTGVKYWKPKYAPKRKLMFYHIAGEGTDEVSARLARNLAQEVGALTDDELAIASKLKDFYEVLAKRFDIPFEKIIKNYQPRIVKYVNDLEKSGSILQHPMAEGVMDDIWGGRDFTPVEIRRWFDEDRTAEFLQFFVEDDAMMALIKYVDKGLAVEHIKPAWNELRQTLTKIGNADISEHMARFARKTINSFHTAGEDLIRKIGSSFIDQINKRSARLGKLGKGANKLIPKEGGDMMQVLYTLNYLTNMAWRPWLAVRNAQQIWTTLAPRLGNSDVAAGVRLTHKQIKEGDVFIENLRKMGILDRRPPIRGELGGLGTKLNRVSDAAFRMFKGSDDYTRLVAYNTAAIRYSNATNMVREGTIDLSTRGGKKAFLNVSGLQKTDPNLAEEIFQKTRTAFSKAAPDEMLLQSNELIWGKKIIDDTMFIYDNAQAPQMFDGVVGKAFGRYGTYSVGYRANLFRGLKYGTAADKVGFISRFIGNQAALWTAFTALGIKATNFLPGQPAIFAGGPMFDLGIDLIKATDVSSYEGRQARGKLSSSLQQLVPGSLQYMYLKRAIDYIDKGDWYKGILSITSTPVITGPNPLTGA